MASVTVDERALRKLFDRSVVGVALIDGRDRLTAVNDRFAEVLGYAPQELVGRTWLDITYMGDRDVDRGLIDEVRRGEREDYSFFKRFHHKSGSLVPMSVQVDAVTKAGEDPEDGRILLKQIYAPTIQAAGDPLAAEALRADARRAVVKMVLGMVAGVGMVAAGTYSSKEWLTWIGVMLVAVAIGAEHLIDRFRALRPPHR